MYWQNVTYLYRERNDIYNNDKYIIFAYYVLVHYKRFTFIMITFYYQIFCKIITEKKELMHIFKVLRKIMQNSRIWAENPILYLLTKSDSLKVSMHLLNANGSERIRCFCGLKDLTLFNFLCSNLTRTKKCFWRKSMVHNIDIKYKLMLIIIINSS